MPPQKVFLTASDMLGEPRRPLTCKEIAVLLNMSVSRVQQVEAAALRKLAIRCKDLREWLEG